MTTHRCMPSRPQATNIPPLRVALLREGELAQVELAGLDEPVVDRHRLAQERPGDPDDAGDGEQGAEDESEGHARAVELDGP